MREPVTERGMATRRRLLQAAEEVFGRRGYHAASIVEITRTAGVGLGTFYEYFDSKETVFRELVQHMSHELRRRIAENVRDLPDRRSQERAGFETFFQFALEHRNLYRIVLESQFVDEDLYRWYYRRLAEGYQKGLAQAVARGEIPEQDLETLAWALLGIGQMLGMRWVLWGNQVPPPDVRRSLFTMIDRLLGGGGDRDG